MNAAEFIGSCGLMQDSKDIQLKAVRAFAAVSCGLMQDSKDIQHE